MAGPGRHRRPGPRQGGTAWAFLPAHAVTYHSLAPNISCFNHGMPPDVRIVERSWLAWIAGRRLRANRVAMVLGRTIHLSGLTREEFLARPRWVAHELAHVEQYRRYGTARFVLLYLLESLRRGYRHNRFEEEARAAEQSGTDLT